MAINLITSLDTSVEDLDLAACFNPDHKSSMILFLERVYGFETDSLLLELLAKSLLPDMRMVVQLDTVNLVALLGVT